MRTTVLDLRFGQARTPCGNRPHGCASGFVRLHLTQLLRSFRNCSSSSPPLLKFFSLTACLGKKADRVAQLSVVVARSHVEQIEQCLAITRSRVLVLIALDQLIDSVS